MIYNIIFTALLLTISHLLQAEPENVHRNFTVWRHGKQVGTIALNATLSSEGTWYTMQMHTEENFLFTISVDISLRNLFRNGLLLASDYYKKVTGMRATNLTMRRQDNAYIIQQGNSKAETINSPILFTALLFYFQEPLTTTTYYSEEHLSFMRIESTGNHTYRIIKPNGDYTIYQYVNGALAMMESETSVGIVKILRQ